jgi:DNA mismatch repair protein MutH
MNEVLFSGSFRFHPISPLVRQYTSGEWTVLEYEDGTELHTVTTVEGVRVRCNRVLWIQVSHERRIALVTVEGGNYLADADVETQRRIVDM